MTVYQFKTNMKNEIDALSVTHLSKMTYSGADILKNLLNNLELTKESRLVFHTWPNLEEACIKLCQMFPVIFPNQSESVIQNAINDAFIDYRNSNQKREAPIKSMICFLNALSNVSYQIQKYTFSGKNKRNEVITWKHFTSNIVDWMVLNSIVQLEIAKGPELPTDSLLGGQVLLSSQIMSANDLGKINLVNFNRNRA